MLKLLFRSKVNKAKYQLRVQTVGKEFKNNVEIKFLWEKIMCLIINIFFSLSVLLILHLASFISFNNNNIIKFKIIIIINNYNN